ncbi:putative cyclin-dependent kinase F-2 [Hordeum vulgare]|nr:putative cyclin-dependent kinase F-2 [Hordeum vulgare]
MADRCRGRAAGGARGWGEGRAPTSGAAARLGKPDYDELVDAWSLGCIMAELLAGEPLLPGHRATNQLLRIFRVLGSMPLVAVGQMPPTRREVSRLRELFYEERVTHAHVSIEGGGGCPPLDLSVEE